MLFVTAGLGGMSGAQPKAGNIAGVVSVTAEINPKAAEKRYEQGWVDELHRDLDELIPRIRKAVAGKEVVSLAYVGNVVDLWERLADEDVHVDLGSDQTSLHNPWAGGYYPVGYSLEESKRMMAEEPAKFKEAVQASLRRHVAAVNRLAAKGMYFFDYGNAFLLESSRAGADVLKEDGSFRYPSYVQDIMGPMYFDYGFGPFRWVCMSEDPEDLAKSDAIAVKVLTEIAARSPEEIAGQMRDNIHWIEEAGRNHLVVGSRPASSTRTAKAAPRLPWPSTRLSPGAKSPPPSSWAATTTTSPARTPPSGKRPTSMTAAASAPTWPSRTSSATASAAPPG